MPKEHKLDLTHADVLALEKAGMTKKDVEALVKNSPRAISHPAISTSTSPSVSPETEQAALKSHSDLIDPKGKAVSTEEAELNQGAQAAFTVPSEAALTEQALSAVAGPSASSIAQEEASGMTPAQFAAAVLQGIGAPATAQNIQTVTDWASAEGGAGPEWNVPGNTDAFNPLNTTQPESGSVGTNSANVQSYPDWQEGVAATDQTLKDPAYSSIVSALQSGAPESTVAADVGASPWGTPDWAGSSAPSGYGTGGNLNATGPSTGSSPSTSSLASLLSQLSLPGISSSFSPVGGAITPQTLQQMTNANQAISPTADSSASSDNSQSSYNQMIASLLPRVRAGAQ